LPKKRVQSRYQHGKSRFENCGYLLLENDLGVSFSINFGKTFHGKNSK
jgi:hypothetical protein